MVRLQAANGSLKNRFRSQLFWCFRPILYSLITNDQRGLCWERSQKVLFFKGVLCNIHENTSSFLCPEIIKKIQPAQKSDSWYGQDCPWVVQKFERIYHVSHKTSHKTYQHDIKTFHLYKKSLFLDIAQQDFFMRQWNTWYKYHRQWTFPTIKNEIVFFCLDVRP